MSYNLEKVILKEKYGECTKGLVINKDTGGSEASCQVYFAPYYLFYNASQKLCSNTQLTESLRTRVSESGENLKRKAKGKIDKLMEGMGYNPAIPLTSLQSFNEARNMRKRRKVQRKKTSIRKKKIRKSEKLYQSRKKIIVKIRRKRIRS